MKFLRSHHRLDLRTVDDGTDDLVNLSVLGSIGRSVASCERGREVLPDGLESCSAQGRACRSQRPLEAAVSSN